MHYFLQSIQFEKQGNAKILQRFIYPFPMVCLLVCLCSFALFPSSLFAQDDLPTIDETVHISQPLQAGGISPIGSKNITNTELLSETHTLFDGSQFRYPVGWEITTYAPGIDVLYHEAMETFSFMIPPLLTAELVTQSGSEQDLTAILVEMFLTNEEVAYTVAGEQILDLGERRTLVSTNLYIKNEIALNFCHGDRNRDKNVPSR